MPQSADKDRLHSHREPPQRASNNQDRDHRIPDRDHRRSRPEHPSSDRDYRRSGRSISPDRRRSSKPDQRPYSPRPRELRREDHPHELERHNLEGPSREPSRSRPRSRSALALTKPQAQQVSEDTGADAAERPNFAPSGKLAAETKTLNGIVLKYHEPPEARKPSTHWRLYVFKGEEQLDVLHVHRQSAYLFGRDHQVCDVPIDHPSSSKQHAVLQFRQVQTRNEFGDTKNSVKPFLIDLESANATFVNGQKIPEARYYELQSGDVIKFGLSTREFVLIPET